MEKMNKFHRYQLHRILGLSINSYYKEVIMIYYLLINNIKIYKILKLIINFKDK